jgi:hypothetical protein
MHRMLENPYLLGSNKLRRITPMKRIKIFLLSAVLIFAGTALEQGTKNAATRERA